MATPMSAAAFFGDIERMAPVREWPSWRTHNRGTHGDGWGPVNGVVIHHTVSKSTKSAIQYDYDGSEDLPGPLYNVVVDKQGVCHLIGWGRANHAGGGDPAVLAQVIREHMPYPKPRFGEGDAGAVDGNAKFYGIAMLNMGDGKDPYPAVQLKSAATAAAVICAFHGWSEKSVIAHREWSSQKVDPSTPIGAFRTLVHGRIAAVHAAGVG